VTLLPFSPLPCDSGARNEIWKHLLALRELGPCSVLSAGARPVGCGWDAGALARMRAMGFEVVLREETDRRRAGHAAGIAYAAACKALGLERAFGHANPYHRFAFHPAWWRRRTEGADLAVVHYSYFARLPCRCPKAVVLHDLLSDTMWGSSRRETRELRSCDLVVAISAEETERLRERGVERVLWSPPAVEPALLPDSERVGVVGSANRFNVEGLAWLQGAARAAGLGARVYGALAGHARPPFERVGSYTGARQPYRDCGILLMCAAGGTGVQIKGVEALAAGRAIVARRGAMRGLPAGEGAWVEVDTPAQMIEAARALAGDAAARERLYAAARAYYDRHLDHARIARELRDAYAALAARRTA
jgi:glycosyltransferase involved in cell wall biosynthesis